MAKKRIHYGISDVLESSEINSDDDTIFQLDQIPPYINDIVISFLEKEYGEYIFLDRDGLKNVEDRLDKVESRIDNLEESSRDIVIIEEMDMETAKQKVLDYTEKHKIFDIEELHRNIRCDLGILIRILDELKQEGRIAEET